MDGLVDVLVGWFAGMMATMMMMPAPAMAMVTLLLLLLIDDCQNKSLHYNSPAENQGAPVR